MNYKEFLEQVKKEEDNLRSFSKLYLKDKVSISSYKPTPILLNYIVNTATVMFDTILENSTIQCWKGSHRSLTDLYRILITEYKPEATLQETIESLLYLYNQGRIRTLYCSTIKNRTWYPMINEREYCSNFQSDENYYCKKLIDFVRELNYEEIKKEYISSNNKEQTSITSNSKELSTKIFL